MDSDNRRERPAQEPGCAGVPARVQPPGPSMEEWRTSLEREITGRMPFPSRAAEAHFADRSWNGPGIYGDAARRAASTLRAEYLTDRDLVADRWGLTAVRLSPEGMHVRVRPGTTGIRSTSTAAPSLSSTSISRPKRTWRRLGVR